MEKQIQDMAARMSEMAANSFYAAKRHGKFSVEHIAVRWNYMDAANRYEAACHAANREPYAYYNED